MLVEPFAGGGGDPAQVVPLVVGLVNNDPTVLPYLRKNANDSTTGNITMVGGNIVMQTGPQGVILVDSGSTAMADRVLATIRRLMERGTSYEAITGRGALARVRRRLDRLLGRGQARRPPRHHRRAPHPAPGRAGRPPR